VTHLKPDFRAKEGIVTMAAKPAYEDLEQRIKLLEEESIKGRQAQNALRESEERYRTVVENANEGIHIAQDERVVYMNPKLIEMIGSPLAEVTNRPFTDFIHHDDRAMVMDRYRRRLAGQSSPDSYESRTLGKNGRVERQAPIGSVAIGTCSSGKMKGRQEKR